MSPPIERWSSVPPVTTMLTPTAMATSGSIRSQPVMTTADAQKEK